MDLENETTRRSDVELKIEPINTVHGTGWVADWKVRPARWNKIEASVGFWDMDTSLGPLLDRVRKSIRKLTRKRYR